MCRILLSALASRLFCLSIALGAALSAAAAPAGVTSSAIQDQSRRTEGHSVYEEMIGDVYHGLFSWCSFREKTKEFKELEKLVRDVRIIGPAYGFSSVQMAEISDPAALKIVFLLTAPRDVALVKEGREVKAEPAPQYAPFPGDPAAAPGETLYPYLFSNTGEEGGRIFEYGNNAFELKMSARGEGVKSMPFSLTLFKPVDTDTAPYHSGASMARENIKNEGMGDVIAGMFRTKPPEQGAGMITEEGVSLSEASGDFARMTIPGADDAIDKAKKSGNSKDCLIENTLATCVRDTGKFCEIKEDKDGARVLTKAVYNACEKRWEKGNDGGAPRVIGVRYVTTGEVISQFAEREFSLSGIVHMLKNPKSTSDGFIKGMIIEVMQMPEWVITYRPSDGSSPPSGTDSSGNAFPSAPVTENKR